MVALALSGHPFIRTHDIDEARAVYANLNTPIRFHVSGRAHRDFLWEANVVTFGPLTLVASSLGRRLTVSASAIEDTYSLLVPEAGGSEIVHDGVAVPVTPIDAGAVTSLASPGGPMTFRSENGITAFEVVVRRSAMEAALVALTGEASIEQLRFEPRVAISAGVGASVRSLVHHLVGEIERDGDFGVTSPLVAASLTDALIYDLLARQPHNHSARLARLPAAAPAHVRRAEEYIDAHVASPLTLAELAAASGASVRSLQEGFRRHRGCSPMEFVRQRRLELAHRRLLVADPGATVASVALSCGFSHLSRFSALYRARFGEAPGKILRQTVIGRARDG